MTLKKILLVDDEQAIRDLLQMLLESQFDNEVVFASSGNEAIKILQEDSSIGLILSDYNMPDGNGGKVYQYNHENNNLPFLLITGGFIEDYPEMQDFDGKKSYYTAFIPKPFEESDLYSKVEFGLQSNLERSEEGQEYIRVNIEIFLRQLNKYQPDLFIKLNDGKVVKIFTSDDFVEDCDLVKYKNKNLKNVFLTSADFKKIKGQMMETIFEELRNASTAEEAMEATSNALHFMVSGAHLLGISKEQAELVEQSVESCLRNLEKEPEFSNILKVFRTKNGYLVSHSVTTLHLCYMVLKKANLYTPDNMQRLSYSALLHDYDLVSDQESAILDKDTHTYDQLSSERQKEILNHPLCAAESVTQFNNIPADCEIIIKLHHEKPDGTGFPRGVNRNQFSVLSAAFNLCLRVADHLYYNEDDKNSLQNFVDSLKPLYGSGPFKTPYQALCDLVS